MQAGRSRWRIPGTSASRIEDSLRLRLLGLSTYWLAALAVAWVGGSPWSWAGGGIAVTVGHAFSWHRRHRSLGVWSMVLLFFASQQAFELSFGILLLGYVALLAAFLAVSLFEDEGRASGQARGHGGKTPILGFWSATAAGVLLLSVGAFLVLPRGEGNAVGYQQASILPITGDPTGTQPGSEPIPQSVGQATSLDGFSGDVPSPGSSAGDSPAESGPGNEGFETPVGDPGADPGGGIQLGGDAVPSAPGTSGGDDGVVMHVRSPVASYWRGQAYEDFEAGTGCPRRGPRCGTAGPYRQA